MIPGETMAFITDETYSEAVHGDFASPYPTFGPLFGLDTTISGTFSASDQDPINFDIAGTGLEDDDHPRTLPLNRPITYSLTLTNADDLQLSFGDETRVEMDLGGTATLTGSFTLTSGYRLYLMLSAYGSTATKPTSYTLRLSDGPATPTTKPDLTETITSIETSKVQTEQPLVINHTLSNSGKASIQSQKFATYLSTDKNVTTSDLFLGEYTTGTLAAGASQAWKSTTLDLPKTLKTGTYYVAMIADYTNAIAESREDNNVSNTIAIQVTNDGPRTVDLGELTARTLTDTVPLGSSLTYTFRVSSPMTMVADWFSDPDTVVTIRAAATNVAPTLGSVTGPSYSDSGVSGSEGTRYYDEPLMPGTYTMTISPSGTKPVAFRFAIDTLRPDEAGNNTDWAKDLGRDPTIAVEGSVSRVDTDDFYKITTSQTSSVLVTLVTLVTPDSTISSNVKAFFAPLGLIERYNPSTSFQYNTSWVGTGLESGTYFIDVNAPRDPRWDNVAFDRTKERVYDYTLTVQTWSELSGLDSSGALALGRSPNRTVSDYVGLADAADAFRFTLDARSAVDLKLLGDAKGPNVTLRVQKEAVDGFFIIGDYGLGRTGADLNNRQLTLADLDAGTYRVTVLSKNPDIEPWALLEKPDPLSYTAMTRYDLTFATRALGTAPLGILEGTAGNDRLVGGNGNDTLRGNNGNDALWGLGGRNTLVGGSGDDILYSSGLDVLDGGAGSDSAVIDRSGSKAGLSFIMKSVNGITTLVGDGTTTTSIGHITLTGGSGNDRFVTLSGTDVLTGGAGNDTLDSGTGDDRLDGGLGADRLVGGFGNDTYTVDNGGDQLVEGIGQGHDTVLTTISYRLAAEQEIEVLRAASAAGTGKLTLIGNEIANALVGNAGANTLDGAAGADALTGLAGNDTYRVDHGGDRVIEAVGGGRDTVLTTISYKLADGQEIEVLQVSEAAGTGKTTLVGNAFAQTITGNAGANTLDGAAGADTLIGLQGNDTYLIDNGGDRVIEAAGGGRDTVLTAISQALAAGQEIEILATQNAAGTAAINLVGNAFANTIRGNAGKNLINGREGADVLTGGRGADTFVFDTKLGPANVDRIADFAAEDTIRLSKSVFAALAPGQLRANEFKDIAKTKVDADDHILYDSRSGDLFYDADGSGKSAAVKLAVLDNKSVINATDFFVV